MIMKLLDIWRVFSTLLLIVPWGGHAQSTGNTTTSIDCNFEDDSNRFCNFTQDATDDFDWTYHQGATSTQNTGPLVDHTYGTESGHYIFTETSHPRNRGDISRLISPTMAPTTMDKCFTFYYQLNGEDVGKLRVKIRGANSSDSDVLKEWVGDQGNVWLKASISITTQDNPFNIIFESVVGESYRGDMAIDDLLMVDNACPIDELFCPFESSDLCGFKQDKTDDFDFRWNNGNTGWRSGPSTDHTYKNESGNYVYMEASGRQEGRRARLISPMMTGHGGKPSCLIFYYHMYGYMMGELSVYIKNSTSESLGDPQWMLSGNRGDKWRAAELEIKTPYDYQIVFDAERGESFRGDIAIDDVNVTFTDCPGHHIFKNESSVTCDFEEAEMCHYTQDTDDQFDWTWTNRGTWFRFTGPSVDHTRGDELGFFIYIEGRWASPRNAKARITSPEVPAQRRASCLEFWYHMYGRDVEQLRVFVKASNDDDDLPDTADWEKKGDQGDLWHRATIDINLRNTPFKIVFEGQRGVFFRDDIAIDDVQIYESSPCPPYVTTQAPPTTPPAPWDSIDCTFEVDYCNYTQSIDDVFDWERHQGSISSRWWQNAVAVDHTTGTNKGHYMKLTTLWWWLYHRSDDNARMVSPPLRGSSGPRCLKFWFLNAGYYADYLNVYIVQYGYTLPFDPHFSIYGDKGLEWKEASVPIPPSTYSVSVVFEGILSQMWSRPDTAIDDVSVVDGECPQATEKPLPTSADCDFEGIGDARMCGYTQDVLQSTYFYWRRRSVFPWQINMGSTSTNGTGPPADHTYSNMTGHYLYAEASQPRRPDDRARITSPVLTSRGRPVCIQFYYYMAGKDIGSLVVLRKGTNLPEKEIYRAMKKSQRWLSAYVEINDAVDDYQIIFEGTVGNGKLGDIAIDDIRYLAQPCSGLEPESVCGFDKGYEACMYAQDDLDTLEWVWFDAQGIDASPLGNTSASVGSFLYITGDAKTPSKSAILRPPLVPRKRMDHCMMYDVIVSNDPDANLVVALENRGGTWRSLQTVNTSTAAKWKHFDLDIPLELISEDPFQIRFSTSFGNKRKDGIIAIDNVTISQGSCDVVKSKAKSAGLQGGGGGGRGANIALGVILALVITAVLIVLVVVWYFVRRPSGFPDMPFAIKYKNKDENINPVTLSSEPGIANPVYEKAGLENNS